MARISGLKTLLGVDIRALALFRVALGALLATDTLLRARDLSAHYSDQGVLPAYPFWESSGNELHISLHLASGTVGWQSFLFALTLLAAVAVAVGYRTRAATVVAWVLLVSVQNRNPLVLNGGDVLLRLLYFWAMFLPLGERYAVDAALTEPKRPMPPVVCTCGTAALILQVAMVYLVTAALKSGREWWPDGTASYLALSLSEFTTPFGEWLKTWGDLLRVATFGVYGLEAATALLILCPFYSPVVRLATIAALTLMHLNFALAMRLGLFPVVSVAALLPLLPAPALDWLSARLRTPERAAMKLYFDGDCGFCKKIVYLLRELLLLPEQAVQKIQDVPALMPQFLADPSWVVVDASGGIHRKWAGVAYVCRQVPLASAVCRWLPLTALTPAGDRLYDWVARHRRQLGAATRRFLPWRASRPFVPSRVGAALALFFLAYVAAWNLKTLPSVALDLPGVWGEIGPVLRLDQRWNMFAPFPLRTSGWYVLPGELRDGRKVDVLRGEDAPPDYTRPELVAATYGNARWRKYMMNMHDRTYKDQRLYYGRWLCRTWNKAHAAGSQLRHFDIVYLKQTNAAPGGQEKLERETLWQHDCFKHPAADN